MAIEADCVTQAGTTVVSIRARVPGRRVDGPLSGDGPPHDLAGVRTIRQRRDRGDHAASCSAPIAISGSIARVRDDAVPVPAVRAGVGDQLAAQLAPSASWTWTRPPSGAAGRRSRRSRRPAAGRRVLEPAQPSSVALRSFSAIATQYSALIRLAAMSLYGPGLTVPG